MLIGIGAGLATVALGGDVFSAVVVGAFVYLIWEM